MQFRRVANSLQAGVHALLSASNRLRLPGGSVLPVAGAIVGIYSGLAAGLFANLILLFRALTRPLRVWESIERGEESFSRLLAAIERAPWHPELVIVGGPLALGALALSRVIQPGEPRDTVKRRLRVLALLVLGALSLYYPLVALGLLDAVIGGREAAVPEGLPFMVILLAPAVGGLVVGRLLHNRPETHGHGVPEVVMAIERERGDLDARGGLLKLIASAVTIGSGGSAGREGPIVFGGAAFGATVGKTLGFSRKELSILMASGAGAGIAASFNAPIAGAVFALEIILREFELKVFSPIILASVTATLVGRGVIGRAPMLERINYQMVSGWEVPLYAALGLSCGLVAYAFVRLLHASESFFVGQRAGRVSAWMGRLPLPLRAGLGGLITGALGLVSPVVWGTGHEYVNAAALGQVGLVFLLVACVVKVVGTSVTLGSGGSGGTFFPAVVMGGMAGGAFGVVAHALFPSVTAPGGAYAMVGLGGVVAGFTRGPLTGMMMVYELTGNYAIILPLMVTCTIASALCHALVERSRAPVVTDEEILRRTKVGARVVPAAGVPADTRIRTLLELLLSAEGGALPVLDAEGRPVAVAQLHHLREVWRDEALAQMLNAADVAVPVQPLVDEEELATALERMDHEDVDALPVTGTKDGTLKGLITRAGIRRYLREERARQHGEGHEPVAATEV